MSLKNSERQKKPFTTSTKYKRCSSRHFTDWAKIIKTPSNLYLALSNLSILILCKATFGTESLLED